MFKAMEMMAFLPRDTLAKACRSAFNRFEAVVDDGCTFIKKMYNTHPNVHFQKVSLKRVNNDRFVAFSLETSLT